MTGISITEYKVQDSAVLLELLLKLQVTYFQQNASAAIQEIREEHDSKKSYQNYIAFLNGRIGNDWKVLLAGNSSNKIVGFIIGSIASDEELVKGNIGKLEDWFVEEEFRGRKAGIMLYNELENWFKTKGCQQVVSDTWYGNELSVEAHQHLGFFISGISFSKKLQS